MFKQFSRSIVFLKKKFYKVNLLLRGEKNLKLDIINLSTGP